MKETYSIPLSHLIGEFNLSPVYLPDDAKSIMISNTEVNRPGLALAGYFEKFERSRIQLIGLAEYSYLQERDEKRRDAKIDDFFRHQPVAVILTTDLSPFDRMREMAEQPRKHHCTPFLKGLHGLHLFLPVQVLTSL